MTPPQCIFHAPVYCLVPKIQTTLVKLMVDVAASCGRHAGQKVLTRDGVKAMYREARKRPPAVSAPAVSAPDENGDEEFGAPSSVRDETASELARLMHCMCDERVRPNLAGVAEVFVIFF